jgi:aryl-alcohol dehydrogenase-like predicted oxidoreductase
MMIHSCPDLKTVAYAPFHEAMEQMKKEGKLRFVGLSNHGSNYHDVPITMEKVHLEAIRDGRFDVLLLVYSFLKRRMGETIMEACQKNNIGVTLMKVNPIGSYYAYKARLDDAVKEGKPTMRLQLVVSRLKKRVNQCQNFIKKHNLHDNEAIRTAAYRFVLENPKTHTALFKFSSFDEIDSVVGISGTRFSVD